MCPAASPTDPERSFEGPPLDCARSWGPLRLGMHDPTVLLGAGAFAKAWHTADGPATLQVVCRGDQYRARAWGPGAERALWFAERVATIEDAPLRHDDPRWVAHPLVSTLARRFHELRLARVPWVSDVLVQKILEQRVRWGDAARSYRAVVLRYGRPAPGPLGLRLPVEPSVLRAIHATEWLALGVDRKRSSTLREAARAASHLDAAKDATGVRALLAKLAGVGPWTTACVLGYALGDPDAVIVGDLKLPSLVSWALAREPRATDERMLDLLAPFTGHRFRVQRWLQSANIVVPWERRR